jgi:HPt (histidine-containing phosphotransfer) domain-containing protein
MNQTPPSPDEAGGAVLNADTIRAMRAMAGEAGFGRIRAQFLSSSAQAVAELARAAAAGDEDVLRRKAHMLKGSSSSMGACGLEALCVELEEALAGAPGADRAAIVARMAGALESARRALAEV